MESKIKITFTEDLQLNDRLLFAYSIEGLNQTQFYRFETERTGAYKVKLGIPTINPGERNAINFKQAFELDNAYYISSGIVAINVVGNEVTITANNVNSLTTFSMGTPPPTFVNAPSLVFEIENGIYAPFLITDVVFSEASSNPCQNIKVRVESNVNMKALQSPIFIDDVNNTFVEFEVLRDNYNVIQIEDYDLNYASLAITSPQILSEGSIDLQINNSPNGSTVIVNDSLPTLELSYSLDNINFQSENNFNSLASGNYTLYVKDNYGCQISKEFYIDEFGVNEPYFYISKADSIRYANRINFGDSGNYKNDENTLGCEVLSDLPWIEYQQLQTGDIITTQFKSNYTNNIVNVVNSLGVLVPVLVEKKTNNIGNKQLLDARKYNLGFGKTGLYFLSGNAYDFDTELPNGETFSLNGYLPIWAKVGNYVRLGASWFLIEDVFFDENKNADVLVISNIYLGAEEVVKAGSVFNMQDYEVYEFSIDMVNFIDEVIQISIESTHISYNTIRYLSEKIDIKVKQEDTLEIRYWNEDNTDIFYETGIKHLIRYPYNKIEDYTSDPSENFKTDNSTILISSDIYEGTKFTFEPNTLELMRKLRIALSCKFVYINNVKYVKESIEVEGAAEKSNLYRLIANMVKSNMVFTNSGIGESLISQDELIGLIDVGSGGFIKY